MHAQSRTLVLSRWKVLYRCAVPFPVIRCEYHARSLERWKSHLSFSFPTNTPKIIGFNCCHRLDCLLCAKSGRPWAKLINSCKIMYIAPMVKSKINPEIEFLRATAILIVVFDHLPALLHYGRQSINM